MLLNDMHNDWDDADNDTREGICKILVAGDGYWSEHRAIVRITELRLGDIDEEKEFGELCVHFNTDDWRVDKHGLIYTDSTFMEGLQKYLTEIGLDGSDVSYSEQGMQGDNYVSCDAGAGFIASYAAKYPEQVQALYDEMYS